jgi:hypothetical protein
MPYVNICARRTLETERRRRNERLKFRIGCTKPAIGALDMHGATLAIARGSLQHPLKVCDAFGDSRASKCKEMGQPYIHPRWYLLDTACRLEPGIRKFIAAVEE